MQSTSLVRTWIGIADCPIANAAVVLPGPLVGGAVPVHAQPVVAAEHAGQGEIPLDLHVHCTARNKLSAERAQQ